MRKTKILAFALTVIMVLSMVSVSAFAAYEDPTFKHETTTYADAIASGDATLHAAIASTGSSWHANQVNVSSGQVKSTYPNMYHTMDGTDPVMLMTKYPGVKNYSKQVSGVWEGDYKNVAGKTSTELNAKVDEGNNAIKLFTGNEVTGTTFAGNVLVFTTVTKFLNFDSSFMLFYGCLKNNGTDATGKSFHSVSLTSDGDGQLSWNGQKLGIYLVKGVYYTITMALSDNGSAVVADIYLDGVQVANDLVYIGADKYATLKGFSYMYVNKMSGACSGVACPGETCPTRTQITDNPIGYYSADIGSNKFYTCEHCKDLVYMKSASFMSFKASYLAANPNFDYIGLYNSGNTVNGYDLTIDNGVLGLNYYLNLQSDVLADENAKVVFTTPRGEVQEKLVKDVAAETNGSYKFTATVSSVEMAKDITMEIKSGEKVYKVFMNGVASDTYTYSVKTYAEKLLSDATYGKIAKAMLNYGAYAQEYFKFDTENLANANCGYTTELSAVNNDVSNVSITGDAPAGTKAALVLDSNTSIVIYDKDGNKIGEKKGINSLQLDTEYTIELTGGTSVTVSVLAIGEKVLESDATSQSYKDLIKTLKLFSDASKELNP